MGYSDKIRAIYQAQIKDMQDKGLLKQERFIHSTQAADIEVEFPTGATLKKVINMCANNYLGLSSHPEIVKAAHEGLDTRGYGMSSVRFICGTQDIHRELEKKLRSFWEPKTLFCFLHAWMQMQVCSKPYLPEKM